MPVLVGSDRHSVAALEKFKDGEIVRAEIKRPRHPKHHRKYWALINLVHGSTAVSDIYATPEKLHQAIKGLLGHWEPIQLPTGEIYKVLKSTDFAAMDQTAFEDFYARAVDVIVTQIVPHLDREDLAREVEAMTK